MKYIWGFFGILVILLIAFLLSNNKKKINLRTVLLALAIQLVFAFVVLKWSFGRMVLQKLTDVVNAIVTYANEAATLELTIKAVEEKKNEYQVNTV